MCEFFRTVQSKTISNGKYTSEHHILRFVKHRLFFFFFIVCDFRHRFDKDEFSYTLLVYTIIVVTGEATVVVYAVRWF